MLFRIMDLRAYAKAKEVYDEGQKETDVNKRPKGDLIDRVSSMTFELAKEEIERRRN
mgnify:CR=1 FL=1